MDHFEIQIRAHHPTPVSFCWSMATYSLPSQWLSALTASVTFLTLSFILHLEFPYEMIIAHLWLKHYVVWLRYVLVIFVFFLLFVAFYFNFFYFSLVRRPVVTDWNNWDWWFCSSLDGSYNWGSLLCPLWGAGPKPQSLHHHFPLPPPLPFPHPNLSTCLM